MKLSTDMALPLRRCLLLMIVLMWQASMLVGSCLEESLCKNNVSNCKCPYNVTFEDHLETTVSVCGGNDVKLKLFLQSQVNKTWNEVKVSYNHSCNTNSIELHIKLVKTLKLSIRNTNLSKIAINVSVEPLQELFLSANKLVSVTKGQFQLYSNLRTLDLSDNQLATISSESFDGLTRLEYLDLSGNNLTNVANVFTSLKNLQHLNLSRNTIEFIHENYFNNWLLQHLDVSHNNLRRVSPGALQLLPNLARLLLSDNPQLGSARLDSQLLVGTGRRLQQIDASRTGLLRVPEAFTHSVRFLSLLGNRITSIRCGDLDSYPLLQSLDFSDNKIVLLEDDSLGRLEMLLFLNINRNLLSNVPRSLPDELKYLSINNNMIRNVSMRDFKDLPNLRILMLKSNQILYIQDHAFDDLLSLEMLDLSDNPIASLSWSTFEGPLSLRDLRLCFLNVSMPPQDGLFPVSAPESVQMLHLQSSPGLAKLLLGDSAALAAFSHLQYLDLRMNNLTEIRSDLLFYLAQLKTLRLHGNNINCSAELWLKDWMRWNKSLSDGETCYFSTSSEIKSDITKYNCTFPETFTITDSLPPVNLYSTEMINKLLRYYGYTNNKTDKALTRKIESNEIGFRSNKTRLERDKNITWESSNDISTKMENSITLNNVMNDSRAAVKARESSKVLDQSKIQNESFNMDHRVLDLELHSFLSSRNSKRIYGDGEIETRRRSGSVKRLNTALNVAVRTSLVGSNGKASEFTASVNNDIVRGNGVGDTNTSMRTEYSPYRSVDQMSSVSLMGIVVVSGLVLSLVLASVGWRQRRRQALAGDADASSERIEVANISGGVLW